MRADFNPVERDWNTRSTWIASSRVGVTTRARGPGPFTAMSRSTIGRMKASVFPEPVGAWMTTSRPRSRGGMASTCTATGVSIEFFARALSRWAFTPRSANVVVKRVLLGPLYLSLCWPIFRTPFSNGEENRERETSELGGHEQVYQLGPTPKPSILSQDRCIPRWAACERRRGWPPQLPARSEAPYPRATADRPPATRSAGLQRPSRRGPRAPDTARPG